MYRVEHTEYAYYSLGTVVLGCVFPWFHGSVVNDGEQTHNYSPFRYVRTEHGDRPVD